MQLAYGSSLARSFFEDAREAKGVILTAASTLSEVLRGEPRDAPLHRLLAKLTVVPIGAQQGRAAGELLGRAGMSGHRSALDALVAVVALAQPRPVVLLTSDVDDLTRLTEEPERPRAERIKVARI